MLIWRKLLPASLLIAVGLLAVGVSAALSAPQFTLTDLGPLPHIADDIAPGLSPNGAVATWTQKPDGGFQASYWHQLSAQPIVLGLPNRDLFAADVTSGGLVVGLAKDRHDLRFTQAFFWSGPGGAITLLPTLGGAYASARGANSSRRIVGVADLPGGLHHACLWQNGAAHDLGTLPGGDFSLAASLNAREEIVGVSNSTANGKSRAVIWRQGKIDALGLLPGGSLSAARAVNIKSDVVGWADSYGGDLHPVLWHGGRPQDLGTLGEDPGAAWSLNDAGQVVGSSTVSSGRLHAFFWQGGTMSDLNDLVPVRSGWSLEAAYRISSKGWILGEGRFQGVSHLFLLRPLAARNKTAGNKTADKKTPHVP